MLILNGSCVERAAGGWRLFGCLARSISTTGFTLETDLPIHWLCFYPPVNGLPFLVVVFALRTGCTRAIWIVEMQLGQFRRNKTWNCHRCKSTTNSGKITWRCGWHVCSSVAIWFGLCDRYCYVVCVCVCFPCATVIVLVSVWEELRTRYIEETLLLVRLHDVVLAHSRQRQKQ